MKNTYIIENKFTGYRAEVRTRAAAPSVSTLKKHFRAAKASDCRSSTTVKCAVTGECYCIINSGQGEKVVCMG